MEPETQRTVPEAALFTVTSVICIGATAWFAYLKHMPALTVFAGMMTALNIRDAAKIYYSIYKNKQK